MSIEQRLEELGIVLPETSPPLASYVPVMVQGDMAFVSGQLPFIDGEVVTGTLGKDVDLEDAVAAARACGLMILAQLRTAIGSLDQVAQIVKLGGFVASTPDFTDQHKVVNGASDLMFEVFGEKGRHARAAVGVPALPVGAAVEVDAVIALSRS
ncbi:RidA family protein [Aurantiacibacter poecillastricola]|uniref:RidA family protein n=1 Tax=Aurantiacibacter poecillastricola TaxID=3064385 RepID=UPI00273FDA84|nr:RidA family protein [Aurantiacibacter sp. 219JJ12-13]MDP5260293.1 RidA family protein [Aurantiacibacter sp. 219JJ12-13]